MEGLVRRYLTPVRDLYKDTFLLHNTSVVPPGVTSDHPGTTRDQSREPSYLGREPLKGRVGKWNGWEGQCLLCGDPSDPFDLSRRSDDRRSHPTSLDGRGQGTGGESRPGRTRTDGPFYLFSSPPVLGTGRPPSRPLSLLPEESGESRSPDPFTEDLGDNRGLCVCLPTLPIKVEVYYWVHSDSPNLSIYVFILMPVKIPFCTQNPVPDLCGDPTSGQPLCNPRYRTTLPSSHPSLSTPTLVDGPPKGSGDGRGKGPQT